MADEVRPGYLEPRSARPLPSGARTPDPGSGGRRIAPTALAIFGKSQGTNPENLQLLARIGFAAALWHAASPPRPAIFYVPADVGGPDRRPDTHTVRAMLTGRYRVPEELVVTRRISNCTFREVRGLVDLCGETGTASLTAVTHAYHARRTARYLEEVLPGRFRVAAVTLPALAALRIPDASAALFADLAGIVSRSVPRGADAIREAVVEAAMTALHAVDRSGRIERRLADLVRNPPPDSAGRGSAHR